MNVKKVYEQLYKQHGKQGWWPVFALPSPPHRLRRTSRATLGKPGFISDFGFQISDLRVENGVTYGIPYSKLSEFKIRFRDPYFEIAIGAILTQNTTWKNVAVAIKNLYEAEALTPEKLLKLHPLKLQKLIRPAGYYRQKAKKLRLFAKWLVDEYKGDILQLKRNKKYEIRNKLLERWGIGPETADSIILYALNKSIFVIDEYTRRLCKKYGILFTNYDDYRKMFEKALPKNVRLFQEYHALIVAHGKS